MKTYKFYTFDAYCKAGGNPKENEEEIILFNPIIFCLSDKEIKAKVYSYHSDMILPLAHLNIPTKYKDLAAAFDFDIKEHPDETVFITTNAEEAYYANMLFGEDSIILI